MGSGSSRGQHKPTLYYASISAPCRAVLMAAKAANIALELKTLNLMAKEQLGEEFIKINPEHTVPTLVDQELHLWESRAILTYLVDKYAPGHSIYPKSLEIRARIDRLLFRDISFVFHHIGAFVYPQLLQQQPPDADKQQEVEKVFDYLESSLTEQFFVGNTVTLADISILASLSMLQANDWKFERWSKVNEWRNRMKHTAHYDEVYKPWEDFLLSMKQRHQDQDQE
jgi:glutathione S-transferase